MFQVFFLVSLFSFSQEYIKNTKGSVVVKGQFKSSMKVNSGTIFLHELKGNQDYIIDSTTISANFFAFNNNVFETGVYRLSFNNANNFLDFVINSQEISVLNIELNNYRIKEEYSIPNSFENKVKKLYDSKNTSIQSKIKLVRQSQKSRDQKIAEITNYENELFTYGRNLNNQYPGTFMGMILSNMQSKNEAVPYLFFSDIDFSDQSIIRSPMLPHRIQTYFRRHSNWPKDKYGFHNAVDVIMENAKINDEVAEFCMYNMLDGFYNTGQTDNKGNPIWMDLCNYIMDEYIFGEGCGDDVEPSELLKERASKFKNLQVGNTPPSFNVLDRNGNSIDLKKTCANNKYTVLMFWASHCQHCMAELPGFAKWFSQNKNNDFEIIAVSLDGGKNSWTKAIDENNFDWINICQFKVYKSPICLDYKIKKTPTMFVLNTKMEIVAKPKSTNQLRSFLLSNK